MANHCQECGEKMTGRIDKKFCSDMCRSAWNNRQNKDVSNYMRKVNNVLRKNRRILRDLNPHGKSKTDRATLTQHGFHFSYYTNTYETRAGKTYRFCYEQGYLELDDGSFALVEKQDYVD